MGLLGSKPAKGLPNELHRVLGLGPTRLGLRAVAWDWENAPGLWTYKNVLFGLRGLGPVPIGVKARKRYVTQATPFWGLGPICLGLMAVAWDWENDYSH